MLSFLFSKQTRRALALLLTAALVLSPLSALAGVYSINDGDITVSNEGGVQTVTQKGETHQENYETTIFGALPTGNSVTLQAESGALEVTISNLNI